MAEPRWVFRGPFEGRYGELVEQFIRGMLETGPPGRPKEYHGWEWAWQFERIYAELLEGYECYHVDGDPLPSKLEACQQVARDDYATRPERWAYDPDERPDKASRRVWAAVKPCLEANERVRNRLPKR